MAIVPRIATGMYDGRPFELIQHVVHIEGTELIKPVDGYLLGFNDGGIKYVLDYDPLLEFDQIRLEE